MRPLYTPPQEGGDLRGELAMDDGLPPLAQSSPDVLAHALRHLRLLLSRTSDHDPFDRAYAIRWLTALVSRASLDDAHEALVQDAAALLAIAAGPASAGALTRVFRFGPITVQLTDAPLDNDDFTSVGAQTWHSACLLADILAAAPHDFGLALDRVRVLELGAGTGLVSLTAAQLLDARRQRATVVATDVHPAVLANLARNAAANAPTHPAVSVHIHALDWARVDTAPPLDAPFDLVLGADIVYEPEHARDVRACVARLLRPSPAARFHLVVPLRPTHLLESRSIDDAFPPASADADGLVVFAKDVLAYEARADLRSRVGDEMDHVHYTIGWSTCRQARRAPIGHS
ncbi:putative methyltransferase-domain-containing protein [Amylocystis lapponica]|nr:putative methyltransferase-domain-containing protein [Amylocystis lapponica]